MKRNPPHTWIFNRVRYIMRTNQRLPDSRNASVKVKAKRRLSPLIATFSCAIPSSILLKNSCWVMSRNQVSNIEWVFEIYHCCIHNY